MTPAMSKAFVRARIEIAGCDISGQKGRCP
jgi:hypothetical protein